MLRPIPARILRSTATVKVANGVDLYQNQTFTEYTVNRVHLQPTERIVKSVSNTDQQLSSILFVDIRHSSPRLNWAELLHNAHELGGDMFVTVRGFEYTVATADLLRDDTDKPHHWEIGLY